VKRQGSLSRYAFFAPAPTKQKGISYGRVFSGTSQSNPAEAIQSPREELSCGGKWVNEVANVTLLFRISPLFSSVKHIKFQQLFSPVRTSCRGSGEKEGIVGEYVT